MNILTSIQARYRNYKAEHFPLFDEGRVLRRLKGIHKGMRCFIVGNGPSLQAEDLTRIHHNGDISFGFNRVFHIFPQTPWRPTYYISQDEKILKGSVDDINGIPAQLKFYPIEIKWYSGLTLKNPTFFHLSNNSVDFIPAFSDDIAKCLEISNTVVYSAIQIAVYMGIKEIYLIGIDHHFHISMNSKGEIIVDPNVKDYFSADYNQDKESLDIPEVDKSTLTFMAARKYADAHGIKIYNATRGGKLEVFERVDFNTLFG